MNRRRRKIKLKKIQWKWKVYCWLVVWFSVRWLLGVIVLLPAAAAVFRSQAIYFAYYYFHLLKIKRKNRILYTQCSFVVVVVVRNIFRYIRLQFICISCHFLFVCLYTSRVHNIFVLSKIFLFLFFLVSLPLPVSLSHFSLFFVYRWSAFVGRYFSKRSIIRYMHWQRDVNV